MSQCWKMSNAQWGAWMKDKPILRRLHDERVFSIGLLQDGNLGVVEECDQWFSAILTVDDLAALIAELEAVRAEMLAAREGKTDGSS